VPTNVVVPDSDKGAKAEIIFSLYKGARVSESGVRQEFCELCKAVVRS
jgi:hypothetical protein